LFSPLLAKAIQDLNRKLEDFATTSPTSTDQSSLTSRFFSSLFARLTHWFADATNGITDFFAKIGHFDEVCAKNSDGTETSVDGDQLKSLWDQQPPALQQQRRGVLPERQAARPQLRMRTPRQLAHQRIVPAPRL
jgi:hypothetical protein